MSPDSKDVLMPPPTPHRGASRCSTPPIRDYNLHPGSEAPPPRRSGGRHMTYSFPPGTLYPPHLPKLLLFRRIGFVRPAPPPRHEAPPTSSPPALRRLTLRHNEAPPPSSPPALRRLTLRHNEAPPPSSPPALRRLTLRHNEAPPPSSSSSTLSIGTRERIRRHYRTLCSLRDEAPPPPAGPVPSQEEGDDVIRREEEEEEEEEEESDFHLALSESDTEQEVTSAKPRLQLQDEEDPLRSEEDEVFAEDYLLRVCDALQASPPLSDHLLEVLDGFSPPSSVVCLYGELRGVLGAWPQLLRDFAAFLSQSQARSCGLLVEQQLFERSRRFLRRLGRGLGEGSAPFQQVVSVLQGSSAPLPEDMEQISSLLGCHGDLHKEFWEFFKQLHGRAVETDSISQNPPLNGDRKRDERPEEAESEQLEEAESEQLEEAESEQLEEAESEQLEEAESEQLEEAESEELEEAEFEEAGSERPEEAESEQTDGAKIMTLSEEKVIWTR
ncbi:hypothetical protein CesoFtcFv8_020451 [Champsocephalus esox]|uniref:GON-4-like protein n=1 Tax=Champsocephalus esox TaxID=159716 RepID=A0AAN8GNN8_9TELE|nr:hypothetical protein CesoFtcFv8_020451 [Champsocephalus esox]